MSNRAFAPTMNKECLSCFANAWLDVRILLLVFCIAVSVKPSISGQRHPGKPGSWLRPLSSQRSENKLSNPLNPSGKAPALALLPRSNGVEQWYGSPAWGSSDIKSTLPLDETTRVQPGSVSCDPVES